MYNNYTNYQNKNYNRTAWKNKYDSAVKKKVKHFTDLDVYQKSQESAVFCAKEVYAGLPKDTDPLLKEAIGDKMLASSLSIPHLFAEAHSKRFGAGEEPLLILDRVMLGCNKMVAYLEQARDILHTDIEAERWEEQIQAYHHIRQKTLNLQRTWRKYIHENQQSQ